MKNHEFTQAGSYPGFLRPNQEPAQPAYPNGQQNPAASFISGVRRSGRGTSTAVGTPLLREHHRSHIEGRLLDAATMRTVQAAFEATYQMLSGDRPPIFDQTLRGEPDQSRQLPPAPPQHEQDNPPIYRQIQENQAYTQLLWGILEGLRALPDAPAGHDPDARQQVEITPHPERVDEVGYGAAYEEAVRAEVDDAAALALNGPTLELPTLYQSEGTIYHSVVGTLGQEQLPPA